MPAASTATSWVSEWLKGVYGVDRVNGTSPWLGLRVQAGLAWLAEAPLMRKLSASAAHVAEYPPLHYASQEALRLSRTDWAVPVLVALVGLLVLLKYSRHAVGSQAPKSPVRFCYGNLPIVGTAFQMVRVYHQLLDYLYENVSQDPTATWFFSFPWQPSFFLLSTPANVDHILRTNFENYIKGKDTHERMHDVLGNGIFVIDGASWKAQRKTAANIFNIKNFRDFTSSVFAEEAHLLVDKLGAAAKTKEAVDLQDLFFRFTLDSFSKIGFGVDLGSMSSREPVPFAIAFDRAQSTMDNRFFNPLWRLGEFFLPYGAQHRKDVKVIKNFGHKVIADRRKDVANDRNDLLSLFMKIRDADGNGYSDEQLSDYVLNFIIAGRDTTAQALSWVFFMLSKHPEVEAKLLEEIHTVFGAYDPQETVPVEPTYDQIKDLKYAKAVFLETLRFWPSVPKDVKFAIKQDTLPDGTIIPAGAGVAWSNFVMGRLESIWGPTASTFDPTRWLNKTLPSPAEYPVFNLGPRVCLGKSMAETEGVYVMVTVLREFKVSVLRPNQGGVHVRYGNSLTLPMKDGIRVKVEKRV